jgi:hypothetical protein
MMVSQKPPAGRAEEPLAVRIVATEGILRQLAAVKTGAQGRRGHCLCASAIVVHVVASEAGGVVDAMRSGRNLLCAGFFSQKVTRKSLPILRNSRPATLLGAGRPSLAETSGTDLRGPKGRPR